MTAPRISALAVALARVSWASGLCLAAALPVRAQSLTKFTTGGRDIVRVDIAGTAVGDFPAGIEMIDGIMEVVDFDGRRMLRASSRSSFLVRLPQLLPQDFTLEFEIVPKAGGNPEDLAVEGTPQINQGAGSANVMWHRDYLQIVGGGPTYDSKVPESFAAGLPGVLTHIAITVQGPMMKLHTNGRLMLTQQRQFVRGRVLRVFLGGQDDGPNAVYLASMRVVDAVGPAGPLAGGTGTGPAATAGAPAQLPPSQNPLPPAGPGSNTAQNQSGLTGPGAPAPGTTIVQNVTVTMTSSGPLVSWQHGTAPAVYRVQRFKLDDPNCCNNTSPASPALVAPPWQDSPPPIAGTYTYQVTATSSSGSAMAGTNFDYIAGTATGPTVVGGQSSDPRTISVAAPPTITAPVAAGAAPVDATFAVTVTLGSNGPIVTWNAVPQATGYVASRTKSDDLNCCNTASGARTFTATSPWQDQPLPMTGTYDYQVVANTPTGQVAARTQFQYTAPAAGPGTLGRAPTSAPSAPSAPASSRFVIHNPTPTTAEFTFDVVASATGYRIRREVAGTGRWTDLTPTPMAPLGGKVATSSTMTPALVDAPLDHRITYRYELHALQADGTYGTTPLTHTPPAPADPTGFTATVTGPGAVKLEWNPVQTATMYRIAGPGTNGGLTTLGAPGTATPTKREHTVMGLPVGAHTWTIASDYQPGGVLTPGGTWPTASATVPAPDPAPRYRLSLLGFRVDALSRELNDTRDGQGDEVYFSAIVNQTTRTGLPLPATRSPNITVVQTKTFGDEAVSVPYGRIKAGTTSPTGGLAVGDVIPASLDPMAVSSVSQTQPFPLRLWEGPLPDDAVIVVHASLWEDDVNPVVHAQWLKLVLAEASLGYQASAAELSAAIANPDHFPHLVWGQALLECATADTDLTRSCLSHGVDRPIGLSGDSYYGTRFGVWQDKFLVLKRSSAERPLQSRSFSSNGEQMLPGTFVSGFNDMTTSGGTAQYRLYFRVERLP